MSTSISHLYSLKEDAYFEHIRHDVLELLPSNPQRILDVGCGSGYTGEAAKKMTGAEIVGIELDKEATEEAVHRLDYAMQGNLEELSPDTFSEGSFDCILCADVLEHMADPWQALEKLSGWLTDDGVLIASIPNIQHITTVLKILFDKWEYSDEGGILDRTHLRFFTLHTIKKMFADSGFTITHIEANASKTLKFKIATILSLSLFKPFTIYQYRVIAKKESSS